MCFCQGGTIDHCTHVPVPVDQLLLRAKKIKMNYMNGSSTFQDDKYGVVEQVSRRGSIKIIYYYIGHQIRYMHD